jgi:hypothetical protein
LDIYSAFRIGAQKLAQNDRKYAELHKSHGIDQAEWELLTQEEYWTADQAREIRTVLANTVEVSMTIAGMPAIPLPGQYVAAVIAECVAPCNRMVACMKSPDTFDAADASGVLTPSEVKEMTKQQMMALVLLYSGGVNYEPQAHVLPREVKSEMKKLSEAKA